MRSFLSRRSSPILRRVKRFRRYRAILSFQRDQFVDTSQLTFPFLDDISGTLRGYRIFTACRTVKDKIFRVEDHLDRLYYSAAGIYMQPPMERDALKRLLGEVVSRNREAGIECDLLVDIIFSGGLEGCSMRQSGSGAHLYIAVQEMIPPSAEAYEKGVALATFLHQRMCPDVKLLNYIGAILAHQTTVVKHDAFEVMFLAPPDGHVVLEGSTFTMFFVDAQGRVLTPPLDGRILDSITRRVLLELLAPIPDLRVNEVEVRLSQLPEMSEAFLVSTTRNVLPVTQIDSRPVGSGTPGPVTKRIMALLDAYIEKY